MPALFTSGLCRRFGALIAVAGLDLAVPRGAVYGFLGPNGAGKTTTIRMLLGLIRPDAGEVRLFGIPLRERTRRDLLRRIGALVETPSVYSHLTGRENLEATRLLLGAPRSGVARVLELVRLTEAAGRLVGSYSLGMRQRLGLALALLGEPELLILDEPTNGLDPAGIREIRDLIRGLPAAAGVTVFLSSHLLAEVEQVATHLGIVQAGRLLFQGTPAELKAGRSGSVALGVDRPVDAAGLLARAGYSCTAEGDGGLRILAAGKDEAARLNRLVVEAGFAVHSLACEGVSLEFIFLDLTGAELQAPVPEALHA
jgi:lantibiotic transport system ATP-binding protein